MRTPASLLAWLALLVAWQASAQAPDAPGTAHASRVLVADEVDRYLEALEDLVEVGIDAKSQLGTDPSAAKQRAAAAVYGAKMQEQLSKHDFDSASFLEVHWNVVMAYMADEMGAASEELKKAQTEQQQALAEMKKSMPPEQYEAAAQAMQSLLPSLGAAFDVPEENRALVEARRARLEALFERAD